MSRGEVVSSIDKQRRSGPIYPSMRIARWVCGMVQLSVVIESMHSAPGVLSYAG